MIPVFHFTAYSNTGKTTYLEKLIAELTGRGVRVAAVKHDAHKLELDKPGKDSWRFAQAGAETVAVSSAEKCAVMIYRPMELEEILSHIRGVDLVLVEGWHSQAQNLIVLYRSGSGQGLRADPAGCLAVVSDVPLDTGGAPLFPLDDVVPMADFLLEKSKV